MSSARVTPRPVIRATTALAVVLTWSGALASAPAASAAPPPSATQFATTQQRLGSFEQAAPANPASADGLAAQGRRGKDRGRDPDPHTPVPPAVQAKAAQKDARSVVAAQGVVVGGGGEMPTMPTSVQGRRGKRADALEASAATLAEDGRLQSGSLAAAGVPARVTLGHAQQPQQTSYYCGPAAVVQALALLGIHRSQNEVADRLRTNAAGYQTSWSGTHTWYYAPDVGSTSRPVADVLGSYMFGWGRAGRYYSADLPEEPSAADVATFQQRLVAGASTGYPLIGDAWEVQGAGNLRLPGHPAVFPNTSYDVFHWYTIHGYEDYGATTYVTDPAAGSPYVSWSSTIPRYSAIDSETLTVINGGRGYVW